MLPYLIVKRKAAEEMIDYITGRKWRRWREAARFAMNRIPVDTNQP
jgi:hypothetical protein